MSHVGQRVRALRKQAKLSQENLARLADVTVSTVNRVEMGTTAPRWDSLLKLAKALGVEVSELVREESGEEEETEPAAQLA